MSVQWPLCFKYTGSIAGTGFIAHIDLCGRVLADQSAEGVWLYGVTPAAIAVSADTLVKAVQEHRESLTKVFIDFAQEADGFASFNTRVHAFFDEADDQRADWDAAVARMQATNETGPDGLKRCPLQRPHLSNPTPR